MRKIAGLLLLAGLVVGNSAEAKKNDKNNTKAKVAIDYLNSNFATYDKLQKTIWANPELGFLENNSSELLKQHLRENAVTTNGGTAMVMVDYKFYGKPAHAAGNPGKDVRPSML